LQFFCKGVCDAEKSLEFAFPQSQTSFNTFLTSFLHSNPRVCELVLISSMFFCVCFLYESASPSFSLVTFCRQKALLYEKCVQKTLMKLTLGHFFLLKMIAIKRDITGLSRYLLVLTFHGLKKWEKKRNS